MQKIFFDHQKFTTQRYGGISRYFANIIDHLKGSTLYDYQLGVMYSGNHYIKGERQMLRALSPLLQSQYSAKAYKLNKWYCEYLLKENKFDLFHPTYYDPYFLKSLKKPMVTTIHDMTHERLPEYFWAQDTLTKDKRLSIMRADKIIAISETTKSDLLKYSDVDENKIEVIYHGIDIETPLISAAVAGIPENYLLFVGDRGGYKNFYLFLNAFKQLSSSFKDIKVVLTGGGSLCVAELEYLHQQDLANKITHVNVTDEQLNYLYQNALLFIYPSLHEGFGLPILEAFKAKCPIVLSDTDCFREIGANAVAYFSSNDAESLKTIIEQLINDTEARAALIAKGALRLNDFPMMASIEKTLQVYNSLK